MKLKEVFGDKRIVGIAGEKSSGKTNNICCLLKDFRKHNKDTPIYIYGFDEITVNWLMKLGNVYVFSNMKQLRRKSNCLIVIDEFQRLKLGNRRYKEVLDDFSDMIYHYERNNWAILSTPNLREFNSVIGAKIERYCVKSLDIDDLVNGSQLKEAAESYQGEYRAGQVLEIPKDKLLIINDEYEKSVSLEHIKEIDNKVKNINIFEVKKK